MILTTKSGKSVDLGNPDNIKPGMVFKTMVDPACATTHWVVMGPAKEGFEIAGLGEPRCGWSAPGLAGEVAKGDRRFVGCDPRYATAADCAEFGIIEGFTLS